MVNSAPSQRRTPKKDWEPQGAGSIHAPVSRLPSRSEPPRAKGVCGSRWASPGTCIFEMLPPAPLSGPLLLRHGWAALPPRVIAALPQTHAQEMKYSSRTYWLLQRLLGKANETDSRKEMSVRHGWGRGGGWVMVRTRWGGASQLHPLPLRSSSWEQVAASGVPRPPYLPTCPRAPISSSGRRELTVLLCYTSQGHIRLTNSHPRPQGLQGCARQPSPRPRGGHGCRRPFQVAGGRERK